MAHEEAEVSHEVAAARKGVDDARTAAALEIDRLVQSARDSVDIPARLRRDPVRTIGLAAGAAFLALGGPKRVLRQATRSVFPRRHVERLLPEEIDATAARLGPEGEQVRDHLERDFASYLAKEHPREPVSAQRSLWRTYDVLLGALGGAAARAMVRRFFNTPTEKNDKA